MTGKTLARYIAGFLVCWGLLALIFFRNFGFDTAPALPFDAHQWQAEFHSDAMEISRLRMAEDLKTRFLHAGMPRAQTRKLLGKPDAASEFDRANHRDVYNLGYAQMGFDPNELVLQFDTQGHLKQYYTITMQF
ncbi:MAG: hypothetical protein QM758_05635 [Armatimonas sp.]